MAILHTSWSKKPSVKKVSSPAIQKKEQKEKKTPKYKIVFIQETIPAPPEDNEVISEE